MFVGASTPSETIISNSEPSHAFGSVTAIVASGEHWEVTGAASGKIRFKPFNV
jgi:hypothetical protein